MFNTATQVSGFHSAEVALGSSERAEMKKRRDSNRNRLRKGLENNTDPKPIGCHTQGSYSMKTMVQDPDCDYDIDDGAYFKAADLKGSGGGEKTALQVRQMVCAALQDDKFATQPEVRKNCVRVYYGAGYHVDVPAYRRKESQDSWGTVTYSYELASSEWKTSDPRAVTKWFDKKNKDLSPDTGDGQFRRVVRLLKAFARSRTSWKGKNLSGFAITKLASDVFYADGRDDWSLRETMKAMASHLQFSQQIDHPVIAYEYLAENGDTKAIHFRDRLNENLKHLEVLDQADCTFDDAMAAWDKVFCTEWFSNQTPPDEDDDDGSGGGPKSPVIKQGGGRFAAL